MIKIGMMIGDRYEILEKIGMIKGIGTVKLQEIRAILEQQK